MKYKINIDCLRDSYIIANTALFLISNFKNDESIQHLQAVAPIEDLISEFKNLADSEIKTIDELVYAYALYIAILLKRDTRSDDFLNNEGNINYEWFPEIKSVYFEKMRPTSISVINLLSNKFSNTGYKLEQDNIEDNFQEINFL